GARPPGTSVGLAVSHPVFVTCSASVAQKRSRLAQRCLVALLLLASTMIAACSGSSPVSPTQGTPASTPSAPGESSDASSLIAPQPASQSIASGVSATLSVSAAGTAPLTFQWYSGALAPIAGATSSSFATPPLTNTTSYWVRVSNSAGSVDSATATITVTPT